MPPTVADVAITDTYAGNRAKMAPMMCYPGPTASALVSGKPPRFRSEKSLTSRVSTFGLIGPVKSGLVNRSHGNEP